MRILLLTVLAAATARAETAPAWVSGNSPDYPKAAFLSGVGEGSTQEKAADKARAEIAKIFSLEIKAETSASASEVSSGGKSTFSQEVSEDVKTYTARIVDGVEIPRTWKSDSGTHYALAVLDRGHSMKVIGDKIADGDNEFADLAERLAKTEGKFSRIRIALKLVGLGKSRRRYNADYRFLNPEGRGIDAPANAPEVLSAARRSVSSVTVQVEVEGVNSERVRTRFIDALTVYGLRVTEKGGRAPDVLVSAVGDGRRLRADNLTWFNAEGSLRVKMSYGATGEVITSFEESGVGSSGDPSTAVGKTLSTLSVKSAARVFKIIVSGNLLDE